MKKSLRSRLLFCIAISSLVLLCIFSVIIYTVTKYSLISHFDNSLLNTAKLLTAVVEQESVENTDNGSDLLASDESGRLEFEFNIKMTPEFNELDGGAYYQIWDCDHGVIVKSPSLGNRELFRHDNLTVNPSYNELFLSNNKPARSISFCFKPSGDNPYKSILCFTLARDTSELREYLFNLKQILLISIAVVTVLSIVIAFLVVTAGLKPIHILTHQISLLNMDNLEKNILLEECPNELSPMVNCLNNLFERLKLSFEREKGLSSDIAHELKTPIAGMQSTIEVCLSRTREASEYQNSLLSCLSIIKSMNSLVDSLLSLARLDNGQLNFSNESICLQEVINGCWYNYCDNANNKNIVFENEIDSDFVVFTDKDYFTIVILNILDNAVEYCDIGGHIQVDSKSYSNGKAITFSNTGCTISPSDAQKAFGAFWRSDTSRTETGNHCGIGLAIVQKIIERLGGTVKIEIDSEDVFTIYVYMPI